MDGRMEDSTISAVTQLRLTCYIFQTTIDDNPFFRLSKVYVLKRGQIKKNDKHFFLFYSWNALR